MEIKNINKFLNKSKSKVKCPNCKKKSVLRFNPFCSKKCSDIDLIKWLENENQLNIDIN